MRFTYQYNNQTYTIQLDKQPDGTLKATIGDRDYMVMAAPVTSGRVMLHIDGKLCLAHCAADKAERYVHLDGAGYQLERIEGQRRKRKGSAGSGGLTAEMPGQVIDVRVSAGDAVTAGQVLVVLEAMKMEIRVTAPADGVVAKLYVSMGDVVERGQVLAEVSD